MRTILSRLAIGGEPKSMEIDISAAAAIRSLKVADVRLRRLSASACIESFFRRKFGLVYMLVFAAGAALGQIGGHTAADGPFTLDDVEDLDLTAGGVLRDWIPDNVSGVTDPLKAISLTTSGLSLASGQTSVGALQYTLPSKQGFVNYSFGVPMPSVKGASTLTNPGNITSFTNISFLTCYTPALTSTSLQVILETYPGPPYPHVYWNYSLSPGTTFQRISINLRSPSLIQDAGSLTLEQLLAQTRYLAFYYFAGPLSPPQTLVVYVDDIKLEGTTAEISVAEWSMY
jgi:hypothetical protein